MKVLVDFENYKVLKVAKQFSLLDIIRYTLGIIYLKRYFVILIVIISLITSFFLSKRQGFKYKATTTFVINEYFGIQDISPGGAYYGENLFELIKSYDVIESTLLSPIFVNSKKTNLASYLIKHNYLQDKEGLDKEHFFENASSGRLTQEQVLVMKILHQKLTSFENLKIGVSERGQILPSIDIYSSDDFFANKFSEKLFIEINHKYNLEKKERKSIDLNNLLNLNDSIENQLNASLNKELVSNVFMLNKSKSINMASNTFYKNNLQINIESIVRNKSNLLQLIINKNKQVDLIEVIDTPKYPLLRIDPPFLRYTITFFLFSLISTIFFFGIFMKK
jgi:hypothetical protein